MNNLQGFLDYEPELELVAEDVEYQFRVSYCGYLRILCVDAFSQEDAFVEANKWCDDNNADMLGVHS